MRKRTCPKCGAEVFASDDVCMDCGADLAERRQLRAAPPAEPAPATEAPGAGPTVSSAARWL